MTLVVASTAEVRDNPYDGSVVVTKPTGVSVGELLVIVAATTSEIPSVTVTGFSESFAFGHDAGNANRDIGFSFLWRIADSSDVSASNYTVSGNVFAAYMLRVTGWTSGEPVFTYGTYETSRATSVAGAVTGSIDLIVPTEQLLIMGFGSADETNTTYTTPTVSPSDPAWTLLSNFQSANAGNTKRSSCRVAYAIRSEVTNLTSFGITADQDNSNTNSQIGFVACICTPQNATVSNALLESSNEYFSPLTASTQEPNNDFQEISPEIFTQSARAINKTQWSNQTKPTTNWENLSKL